ncbi:MAG: hypothetical protein DMD76_08270 [Candidatus Rokuibacteriota bacterium]|nr:MAG: hypothetical protein DMD76_08270 [Candidatus Rokubacteria bacterium]
MHTAFDDVSLAPMIAPTVGAAPELERLGDEIAELSAHLDAATARLLDLIREFDARGGWGNGSGFRSCAHWLTWRVELNPGAARERVRVARALGTLPRLAEALARGELSYSKVRALTRVATPETEERLLRVGRAGTAEHVERIVRGWRRVDRIAEAKQSIQRHRSRGLHVYQDEDGMVVVRGRLEPETGAVLMKALEAAREALYERARSSRVIDKNVSAETLDSETGLLVCEDTPTWGQQQADALALLAETALHHGIDPGTPGERYQVVVHVDAPVLAESDAPATPEASAAPDAHGQSVLEDGAHVSAGTSQRLACDATRVAMRHDADGHVTDVGARTRTIPPALRRALQHRDHGCRFPGCGLPFGQGHHIRHWANGGPTTLSNLAMLCRRHHRAVHEDGYQVERLPDGELQFRRPDGRLFPDVPPRAPVPPDPAERLRAQNEAEDLHIHPRVAIPNWSGERLDLGWAIDVLHPLAASNS